MQLALEPETFVSAEASHRFVIAVNNYAAVVLVSPLLTAVAAAAPRIQLDLRPTGLRDIPALLDRGELDLAIAAFDAVSERFAAVTLLDDSFVVVMRHDHPGARQELTPEVLASLPYLEISSSGEDTGFVDDWLGTRGLTRAIAHRAPRLSTAAILASTDLVAVLSRRLAEHWVQLYGLATCGLPFASPIVRTQMLWHRRLDNQPAHLWLRKVIVQTALSK